MSGPYIITTRRPRTREEVAERRKGPVVRHLLLSRVAVATLEEARLKFDALIVERAGASFLQEIVAFPESGGTITLPDGTVIEVEQTTWYWLADEANIELDDATQAANGDPECQQRILNAFNAQEKA